MSNQTNTSEWVKWAVGLAVLLSGGALGTSMRWENRMTTVEKDTASVRTDLTKHEQDARESKAEINNRLRQQDQNIEKVLSGITTVQVDVATIKGYMERAKSKE